MIGKIIVALVLFLLAMLAIVWGLGGGPERAINSARSVQNPLELFMGKDTGGALITLPWQPETTQGPTVDSSLDFPGTQQPDVYDYDQPYADAYAAEAAPDTRFVYADVRQFGDPSPFVGRVRLAEGHGGGSPATEAMLIQNYSTLGEPVSLRGWSLQSMRSGVRMTLPQAAPSFRAGVVNAVEPVSLAPGAYAIVASGFSPVGVSLRENICTAYLEQFQYFAPSIDESRCPAPYDTALRSAPSCAEYAAAVSPCRFPSDDELQSMPPACRAPLADALSYNGCVRAHQYDAGFELGSWRLYLGAARSLWMEHDVIRLLDERNRVVDVVSY